MGRSGGRNKRGAVKTMSRVATRSAAASPLFFQDDFSQFKLGAEVLTDFDNHIYRVFQRGVELDPDSKDAQIDTFAAYLFSDMARNLSLNKKQSPEADFLSQYQLLLARDVLLNNPRFKDIILSEGQLLDRYLKDLKERGAPEDEITQTEESLKNLIAAIEGSKGSIDDLIEAGKERGLDVVLLGEPFNQGSIRVNDADFILAEGRIVKGALERGLAGEKPGVGGSFFQKQPSSEVLTALYHFKNIESSLGAPLEELAYQKALGPLARIEILEDTSPEDRETIDRAIREINELQKAIISGAPKREEIVNAESNAQARALSPNAMARITYADAIASCADLDETFNVALRALGDINPTSKAGQEKVAEAKADLEKTKMLMNSALGKHIEKGMESINVGASDTRIPSEQIKLDQFKQAKEALHNSRNINSAAVWAYMADSLKSDDPKDWVSLKDELDFNTKVIYGSLVVNQDKELRAQAKECIDDEDELRLKARILGKVPTKEIIYLPRNSWAGNDLGTSQGVHVSSSEERPSFVFLENANNPKKVAVHELIHGGQTIDYSSKEFTDIAVNEGFAPDAVKKIGRDINEGLTEALAQVRTDPYFAEDTEYDILDPKASYKPLIRGIIEFAKKAGIKQEDRELFLETLNAEGSVNRVKILQKAIGAKTPGEVFSFWYQVVGEPKSDPRIN